MFTQLAALLTKPELYAPSTKNYQNLWEDEHISKGMLESHLNPAEDGATSNHNYVAKSVQWIVELAPPEKYANLLDLGCGPGVYAERFAQFGYHVTGVDFSKRSIEYAKEQTTLKGSGIEYHYQNYLTIDYTEQFDIITIINKDYPVLSKTDRMALLKKVYQALKPNGKFIFDVFTPKRRRDENRNWNYYASGSFFSEKPHLLLEAIYQFKDDDMTELEQYILITNEEIKSFNCYNHYFTKELLLSEIQPIGFKGLEFYGDIAGKEYSDAGEMICIAAEKGMK